MPQPAVLAPPSIEIGSRSVLQLIFSYRHPKTESLQFDIQAFEAELLAGEFWQRKKIEDGGLLLHLNAQLREGHLLRAYEATSKIANLFDPRFVWQLEGAKKKVRPAGQTPPEARTSATSLLPPSGPPGSAPPGSSIPPAGATLPPPAIAGRDTLQVKLPGPPRLYVVETGYIFLTLGVRAATTTLAAFQDTYAGVVRRGISHIAPDKLPRKKAGPSGETKPHLLENLAKERGLAEHTLRHWLALLVPGLTPDVPTGGGQDPMAVNVVFVPEPLAPQHLHRLRLAHGSAQPVDPSEADRKISDNPLIWEPSTHELCLFSAIGVTWAIHPIQAPGALSQFDTALADRYVYKWILVEHQRLFLLSLSSKCASMSARPDGRIFSMLRLSLLQYTAKFSFGHISTEERHDRFYRGLLSALDIAGLFEEVKGEITEIDEYLNDKRADILNEVLAFLTLVLTPVGLVIELFGRETLPPGDFEWKWVASPRAWLTLVTHWPFQLTVFAAVCGLFVFTRLLGATTVRGILRRIWRGDV
jgi:hypothetical protein